jgi:hypothetical protein
MKSQVESTGIEKCRFRGILRVKKVSAGPSPATPADRMITTDDIEFLLYFRAFPAPSHDSSGIATEA